MTGDVAFLSDSVVSYGQDLAVANQASAKRRLPCIYTLARFLDGKSHVSFVGFFGHRDVSINRDKHLKTVVSLVSGLQAYEWILLALRIG